MAGFDLFVAAGEFQVAVCNQDFRVVIVSYFIGCEPHIAVCHGHTFLRVIDALFPTLRTGCRDFDLVLLCPQDQENTQCELNHSREYATSGIIVKKRTVIAIQEYQPELDFEEAEHSPPFTLPEYQRALLASRIAAGSVDLAIVAAVFAIFAVTTYLEMPEDFSPDRRVLGIYGVCYFALVTIYFFLFMLSASQTPGMKCRGLVVCTTEDVPLDPKRACSRGFGYLISILPLMLGFIWMLLDPEHLTWADKVSGTYIKKI
jgi:uncharacterized RDD family membrane protein YckC